MTISGRLASMVSRTRSKLSVNVGRRRVKWVSEIWIRRNSGMPSSSRRDDIFGGSRNDEIERLQRAGLLAAASHRGSPRARPGCGIRTAPIQGCSEQAGRTREGGTLDAVGFGRRYINGWGRHSVPAGVPAAVGPGRRRRLRQEKFKLGRGFGRVDAEIGQRGMPHIEGREGEKSH